MTEMNHDTFDICYCCGRIIGYAGNIYHNLTCSIACEISEERLPEKIRQQNYDKSYQEFKKKHEEYFKK